MKDLNDTNKEQLLTEEIQRLQNRIAQLEYLELIHKHLDNNNQALLVAIVQSSDDAIIAKDLNGTILSWNKGAERIYGYSAEEVVGQSITILVPPELGDEIARILERISRGEFIDHYETVRQTKDGQLLNISLSISPLKNDSGQIVGASTIARDITRQKQAEEALRRSEELYRNLIHNFPDGAIIIFNKDLRFTVVEGTALAQVGLSREMYEGKSARVALSTENVDQLISQYQEVLAGKELFFETSYNDHSYEVHALPLKNDQGEIVAGMLLSQDVTERRRVEYKIQKLNSELELRVNERTAQLEAVNNQLATEIQERIRLEEELKSNLKKEQELSELKSRFVSMTSHEFRTPLTTILASTELLERYGQQWNHDKRQELYSRIITSTQHMTQMLNDILLVGKAEAGKLEFKPTPNNLAEIFQSLIEELIADTRTGHVFNFRKEGNCADKVLVDEKLLRQIVSNLLSNAVKYSSPGSAVQIDLDCTNLKQEEKIKFSISDTGIGIPAEDLPRIYEVFHRAKNVKTVPGTGLGLTIVKRSVELHQGTIDVTSEVGAGTTFTVILPLRPGSEKA